MLKFLRKRTKVIIWTVVIAFISWGGYAVSTQFQEASRAPGRLFGKEISFQEYQLANRAVQIFSPTPQKDTPPDPLEIEARTWEFLVLSHEAKRRRIQVSDDEVRREITSLLTGAGGINLTAEQYLQWVRTRLREEPREFEKQVREHLRIRKLLAEVQQEFGPPTERRLKRWLLGLLRRARVEIYQPPSSGKRIPP